MYHVLQGECRDDRLALQQQQQQQQGSRGYMFVTWHA